MPRFTSPKIIDRRAEGIGRTRKPQAKRRRKQQGLPQYLHPYVELMKLEVQAFLRKAKTRPRNDTELRRMLMDRLAGHAQLSTVAGSQSAMEMLLRHLKKTGGYESAYKVIRLTEEEKAIIEKLHVQKRLGPIAIKNRLGKENTDAIVKLLKRKGIYNPGLR